MKRITGRCWAFVMYPESMPDNWKDILIETGLPTSVSPLHDKDNNPDETEKKAHYHVIVCYDNPTTYNNVKENVCDRLNATIPIKLESIRGMFRYHIHLDNPEKYQYDDRDRQFFNGFDPESVNALTKTEIDKYKKEILSFIVNNDIKEYCDLLTVLIDNDMNEMLSVASNNTVLFNTFITSLRNKQKEEVNIISIKEKDA